MAESDPRLIEMRLEEAERVMETRLPETVRRIFHDGDGRYRSDGEWWVVWPLERVVAENQAAWRDSTLSAELVSIGDDGTGDPSCVRLDGTDDVVRWSWIDSAVVSSEGTVDDFLAEWATE